MKQPHSEINQDLPHQRQRDQDDAEPDNSWSQHRVQPLHHFLKFQMKSLRDTKKKKTQKTLVHQLIVLKEISLQRLVLVCQIWWLLRKCWRKLVLTLNSHQSHMRWDEHITVITSHLDAKFHESKLNAVWQNVSIQAFTKVVSAELTGESSV